MLNSLPADFEIRKSYLSDGKSNLTKGLRKIPVYPIKWQ